MARKFDAGYYFSEGFHSIFTHGFMSFAAVCMIVACLLIMGSFTLLVVTHEKELVNRFSKRVVAIENGRIISDETGGYYNNETTI